MNYVPTLPVDRMAPERKSPKPAAHIQMALEESCGALITLESLRAEAEEEVPNELQEAVQRAIECLRQAIAELRSAAGEDARVLPGEFVLRAGVDGPGIRRRHTSPRRTE